LFGQSLAVNWLKEEWFEEAMQKTLQSYVAAGRVFAAVVDTCETCEHVTPASVVKHLPHTERIN